MRGIVFDLDGTLVNSLPDVTNALNHALVSADYPPVTIEQVVPAMGFGARQLVAAVARVAEPDRALDQSGLDQLCAWYERAYADVPAAETVPFLDAVPALTALHASGVALGICTNKTTDLAWKVVQAVGLAPTIASLIGRDSTPHPKPDPRHLLDVVEHLGLLPDDVVYVGDNAIDVEVARGAAVGYRHVSWGASVEGVQVLHQFGELEALVSQPEVTQS